MLVTWRKPMSYQENRVTKNITIRHYDHTRTCLRNRPASTRWFQPPESLFTRTPTAFAVRRAFFAPAPATGKQIPRQQQNTGSPGWHRWGLRSVITALAYARGL